LDIWIVNYPINAPTDAYKVLEDFIDESTIFDLTDPVVDSTIAICRAHRIKLPDAVIAATAQVYGLTLGDP
jgi:hypothetical protein